MTRRALALLLVCGLTPGLAGCFEGDAPGVFGPRVAAALLGTPVYFPNLTIQVSFDPDFPPDQRALDHAFSAVQQATGRTHPPTVVFHELPREATDREVWSLMDVLRLDEAEFQLGPPFCLGTGETAWFHLLYVPGRSAHDFLGFGLERGAVVWIEAIRESRGPLDSPEQALADERRVMTHEFGHVIGLVDHGATMQRPRLASDGGHHSASADSVMRVHVLPREGLHEHTWQFGTRDGFPDTFDADDLRDLEVLREEMAAHKAQWGRRGFMTVFC